MPTTTEASEHRSSAMWMALLWLVTRLAMFAVFNVKVGYIANDVRYYFSSLSQPSVGTTLIEYPVPIVWLVSGLKSLTGTNVDTFIFWYAVTMAVLDAAITALLWLRFSRLAAGYWMVFLALIGPLIWFRLDLLVAVMVCLATLYVVRRPAISGAAAALAAAVKLWPALLVLPMIGRDPKALRRIGGFALIGINVGLASLVHAGLHRSASPLTWQSDRGLQVESIAATVPMAIRALNPQSSYKVEFSKFNAYEISGPGTDLWKNLADLSLVAAVIIAIGIGVACLLRPQISAATIMLAMTTVILWMIVTNKTFSPQYMMWLAGPLAALFTVRLSASERRLRAWLVGLGLAAAGLTQVIFPLWYGGVIGQPDLTVTSVLVARNLTVVAMTVVATWWTLGSLLPGRIAQQRTAQKQTARRASVPARAA